MKVSLVVKELKNRLYFVLESMAKTSPYCHATEFIGTQYLIYSYFSFGGETNVDSL